MLAKIDHIDVSVKWKPMEKKHAWRVLDTTSVMVANGTLFGAGFAYEDGGGGHVYQHVPIKAQCFQSAEKVFTGM